MFYCRIVANCYSVFFIALTCYISCSESLQTRTLGLVQWLREHTQNLSQRETDPQPLKLMKTRNLIPQHYITSQWSSTEVLNIMILLSLSLFLVQFPTQTAARERQDIGQEKKARNSACTWKKPEENKQFSRKPSCKGKSTATNSQSHGIIFDKLWDGIKKIETGWNLNSCSAISWDVFHLQFSLPKRKLGPSLCYYPVIVPGKLITSVRFKESNREGFWIKVFLLSKHYSKYLTLLYHMLSSYNLKKINLIS